MLRSLEKVPSNCFKNIKLLKSPLLILQGAILFIGLWSHCHAQTYYFEESKGLKEAYNLATTLQLARAQEKIDSLKEFEPSNMLVYHVENYIDFFTVFIQEEKSVFERLEANKNKRIEYIRKGPDSSPYRLFCEAEINLQWALARSKFEEFFNAGREVYRAFKLLNKNEEQFPDFIANKKSLAILHSLAESIPGIIRFFGGIEGSIEKGMDEIEQLVEHCETNEFLFTKEVIAIYTYMLFYQSNRKTEAYNYIKNSSLQPSMNPLSTFLMAGMAQRNGYNDEALQILKSQPTGDNFIAFHYLDLMMGKSLLALLDPKAKDYILSFTKNFKGQHFIKEAYQKLAWYELIINENFAGYSHYMSLCQSKGNDVVDEDKQALKEAKNKDFPDPLLLKARVLFDGGYYQKSYQLLATNSYKFVDPNNSFRVEYLYRLGRVLQALGNYTEALEYFELTLKEGDKKNYFACNAALQAGLINESQHNIELAKKYFEKCLSLSPKEYKTSLHQKAKSGLDRIK